MYSGTDGIYIPSDEILNRRNYEWFSRMSPAQVLESKMIISKYILIANIPGVKPGVETADYLDKIMSLVTFPGALFLALIAVFPAIVVSLDVQQSWAMFYGGTSLIIMVGVAIDTIQQINSYLLNKHYDGLMKSGKNRKATA